MVKGLTEYLLKFILGVILVALAFFAMKKAYNEAIMKIMEYLGIYKPSLLERAIACSYYRCRYDLDDEEASETEEICSGFFEKGNYLLPAELDKIMQETSSDYKICNGFSMGYPVEVLLTEETNVNKEMIKSLVKDLRCVVYNGTKDLSTGKPIADTITYDSYTDNFIIYGYISSFVFPIYGMFRIWPVGESDSVVYIGVTDEQLKIQGTEKCKGFDPSLISVTLKPGKYYIYTLKKGDKYPDYLIVITDAKDPGYIKLSSDESKKELTLAWYVPSVEFLDGEGKDVNRWFLVEIPSGDKYVFLVKDFTYDKDKNIVKYSLEYDLMDDDTKFNSIELSDSECLNINTHDGCLKLRISGINCKPIITNGDKTIISCKGKLKPNLELTTSSC